jgi:iron complex outermembrane receptor protein
MANTDFNFTNAFVQSTLNTKNAGKFDLQLAGQLKDFGANSFYSLAYPNQFESSKTFMAALNWSKVKGSWTFNAQAYWRRHHDRFELIRDSISVKPSWYKTHNYHMTDVTGGKASASYLSKFGKTTLGIDIRNEHIFSNVLGTSIDSMRAPLEKNGFFTKENNRLIETAMLDHSLKINNWYLSAGAAVTNSTTFGVNGFGGVDIAYEFNENVRVFADVNSALRLPTFTDLYYKSATQLANPNLLPEKSQTIEAGTKMNENNWKLDATVYYRMGQNVIDWVKLPTETIWQSKNLTNVNALGADVSLVHYFQESFVRKISTTYSYLQMDKSADGFDSKYALDYLKHKFIVSIDYQLTKSLSASWVGSYLVRAGNYTVPTSTSVQNYQPYFLLNARILCSKKNYDVFCDVNNLLDTNYADYGGLTQPGINFNVGIRLKL